ncbi:MAG: hypothetical protein F9K21_00420 [Rhodocyclaceae bacterium]|nr:MAG: hypothetical protein F9K21_00420 [Rhodocyclaceae bacterium]CAG0926930.1 hypothetical protein RHDC3_00223 [Rhodocyclaceae bacterium]
MRVKNDSAYTMEDLGNGKVRFSITAAELKPGMGWIVLVGVLGLITYGLFWLVFLSIPIGASIHKKKVSAGGEFIASPRGLEMKGFLLPAEQIHRLVVRNAYASDRDRYVYVNGAVTALYADALSNSIATHTSVGYKLDVEHGGKATTLAGGMTEVTVNGLLTELTRAMNRKEMVTA